MSILTKDALLEQLKTYIGERADDETIKLVEDVSDTLRDYDDKTKDSTDWKEKYEQNNADWAKKYRDRFFTEKVEIKTEPEEQLTEEEKAEEITINDLFDYKN